MLGALAMQTKTLTIQLNNKQLPILPAEPEAYISFATHANGNHIHLDDLYSINSEEKSILIRKEERSKP